MKTKKTVSDKKQSFMMNVELIMRQIGVREIDMAEGYRQLLSLYRSHSRGK